MKRRAISLFLAAVLILGFVPISLPAQAAQTSSDVAIGHTAILDLEIAAGGDAASALVTAQVPCIVVAALYTEDGRMAAAGRGSAAGTGEAETVEIPLSGQALPEYFTMKAYLLGENLQPLCDAYTCVEYTQEHQAFMDVTADDFEGQRVLYFDEQESDNFAVLAEGVLELTCTTQQNILTVDEAEEVYTLSAPNAAARGVHAGDRVVLYAGSDTYSLSVASVQQGAGGSLVFTSAADAELGDFFSYIRVDWTQDLLDETLEVIPEEGATLQGTEEVSLLSADRENIYRNSLRFELERELSDHLSISGALTLSCEFRTVFHYAAGTPGDPDDYLYMKTTSLLDASADLALEVSADNDQPNGEAYEIPLAKVLIPLGPTGLTLDFQLGLPIEASLSGTLSFSGSFSNDCTQTVWKGGGSQNTFAFDASIASVSFEAEGSLRFGCRLTMALKFLNGLLTADIRPEFGVELTGTLDQSIFEAGGSQRHMCTTCIQGEAVPFAKLSSRVVAKAGKWKVTLLEYTPHELRQEGLGFYVAFHTDGSFEFDWGTCPNIAYKQVVQVYDQDMKLLPSAQVRIRPVSGSDAASGLSGLVAYLHEGEYTVTAELDGYETNSISRQVVSPGTISISLEPYDETDPNNPVTSVSDEGTYMLTDYTIYGDGRMVYEGSRMLSTYYRSYPWQTSTNVYNAIRHLVMENDSAKGMIGSFSFMNCPNLASVSLAANTTSIEQSAFHNCKKLTSIYLPTTLTSIGSGAFQYCENLVCGLNLPNVTSVGNNAFESCSSLKTGVILPTVQSLGYQAFAFCTNLTSAFIGGGTAIGNKAFNNCYNMTSLSLVDVTSIGSNAFSQCTGLTRVTLPDTLITLGNGAFSSCTGLTSITVPGSVSVPSDNVFIGCTSMTSAALEEGVTIASVNMFRQCSSLTSVYLPSSLRTIDDGAFRECTSLQRITLPQGLTSISSHAFYDCSALRRVTIPVSVTSIESHAFNNCPLTDVYYAGTEAQWNAIDIDLSNDGLFRATIHFMG